MRCGEGSGAICWRLVVRALSIRPARREPVIPNDVAGRDAVPQPALRGVPTLEAPLPD
jgi:hypothetical protein